MALCKTPFNTLRCLLFFAGTLSALPLSAAETLSLKAKGQKVSISADTLEINWSGLEVNQPNLRINDKVQTASDIRVLSDNEVQWTLHPSNLVVSAQLSDVLTLSFAADPQKEIQRNAPLHLSWFDLPQQFTDVLYLPFSEGMRVPTAKTDWTQYLASAYSGSNTTQDLKMPFWTVEQSGQFISYHLVTATNNQLDFEHNNNKLDMQASHAFTELNKDQPFVVRVSLGKDGLSGARDYRQWRVEHDMAMPLAKKMADNPALEKLVGASHVYLFGRGLIDVADVSDWWGLKGWYFQQTNLIVPASAKKELASLQQGNDWLSKYHKQLLVDSINTSLSDTFSAKRPQLENNAIEPQFLAAQKSKAWLAEHAGDFLIEPERWGQALSSEMLDTLKSAGLSKLWLGLDNWMPAFYQPEAVDKAKESGYMVATYDSYNTAISQGVNDGWLTAQLPDEVRTQCAIEMADGRLQSGFRGNGYYLNPNCQRQYVEQRIADIIKLGRFDSLFLDVDAVAMAREDYRDGSSEQEMLDAYNSRMQWITDKQPVLLGSEDGNSLTTQGIAFAHGMETVGFGWRDKDMTKDRQSPYYLGRWYPDNQPEYFFQSAQVKEPYKTVYFAPQYRVPLYQAVFHDELINSHHWHSDSLKFSDVKAERDLIAMLYNTPAMVHLNRNTASSSTQQRIKALQHYQQGFLPIHAQLWDKALVGFQNIKPPTRLLH